MRRCWLTGFREQPSTGTRHRPPAFVVSAVSCTGSAKAEAAQQSSAPASQHGRDTEGGRWKASPVPWEGQAGPKLVMTLVLRQKQSPACEMSPVQRARAQLDSCWARAARGWNPCWEQRNTESSQLLVCGVCPCSQRETNSCTIRCAKQSSTCTFLTQALAPGVQDQLGTSCAKESKTKTRSQLSGSPSEPYLGIHLLSPFPQGTAPWQEQRGTVWVPLSCCTPGSLREGVSQ